MNCRMDDSPCSDVMDQGKERELEALYKGIQQFDDIRYIKLKHLEPLNSLSI